MNSDRPEAPGVTLETRRLAAHALARVGRTEGAVEAYLDLIREYVSRGRLSRAVSLFQELLAIDGGRGATQMALGVLFAAPQEARTSDITELGRTPIFAGLAPEAFLSVLSTLRRRSFGDGDTIVHEGERGDTMFIVAEGVVRVVRRGPNGEPRVVDKMGEGDFFGEMALVSRAPRLASVIAESECELLELDREQFEALTRTHPDVGAVAERFYKARLLSNLLRASPLFGLLPEETRRRLVDVFSLQSHPEGDVLLEMGKPGKGLFVILRGECGAFHRREDGTEAAHPGMREGDVFGELSLLHDGLATATVRTLTACVVLQLRREWFDDLILSHPQVRERIYALAGERAGRTRELVARDALERRLV